jgi:hypothetical protein
VAVAVPPQIPNPKIPNPKKIPNFNGGNFKGAAPAPAVVAVAMAVPTAAASCRTGLRPVHEEREVSGKGKHFRELLVVRDRPKACPTTAAASAGFFEIWDFFILEFFWDLVFGIWDFHHW